MPDFLVIDTEFGGLPDDDWRWKDIGVTEISAAAARVARNWTSLEVDGTFTSFIKPIDGLLYDDVSLAMQCGWIEQDLAELFEHNLLVEIGFVAAAGDPEQGVPSEMVNGLLADAFFAWLTFNGRDEAVALEGLIRWTMYHFGDEFYKISPWAHNVEADLSILRAACDRQGKDLPCNRAGRCSMILFRIMRDLGLHDRYKADLDTIIKYYSIEIPDELRHTSKGDLCATAQAIGRMMNHLLTRKRC